MMLSQLYKIFIIDDRLFEEEKKKQEYSQLISNSSLHTHIAVCFLLQAVPFVFRFCFHFQNKKIQTNTKFLFSNFIFDLVKQKKSKIYAIQHRFKDFLAFLKKERERQKKDNGLLL